MSGDEVVFVAVLLLRLGIPLLIPRFPFPAIIASLVIDAADQTIFQNYTDLDLTSYQGYDKALDVYYLTFAYLSTVRNWRDPFVFRVGQFLWYYRLTGVVLFELFEVRALLLIFPNTFEYFFIYYEAVRLWWNPNRLSRRHIITAVIVIWVFIKLPQEWWIHIAQLDFTDFLKEDVFGVPTDTSWGDAIAANSWFWPVVIVLVVGLVAFVLWLRRQLPTPDWSFTIDVDRHFRSPRVPVEPVYVPIVSWYTFEKIALVSMVTIIFGQVLPGVDAGPLVLTLAVGFVIVVNTFVSQLLADRGTSWSSTGVQFLAMAAINFGTVAVMELLLSNADRDSNFGALVFFVLLLTLIVTAFDRYHRTRLAAASSADDAAASGLRAEPT